MLVNRQRAWEHYFQTSDREPLIKAYWDSVSYMAWEKNKTDEHRKEDAFQWGMIGLLKAIRTIDPKRVKSKDAWVWLNVRGMMNNAKRFPQHESLEDFWGENEPYQIPDVQDLDTKIYLDGLLDRLPKRESFILRLVYFHDLRRTEIGKIMGLSSMRVGQLEKRALKTLEGLA